MFYRLYPDRFYSGWLLLFIILVHMRAEALTNWCRHYCLGRCRCCCQCRCQNWNGEQVGFPCGFSDHPPERNIARGSLMDRGGNKTSSCNWHESESHPGLLGSQVWELQLKHGFGFLKCGWPQQLLAETMVLASKTNEHCTVICIPKA